MSSDQPQPPVQPQPTTPIASAPGHTQPTTPIAPAQAPAQAHQGYAAPQATPQPSYVTQPARPAYAQAPQGYSYPVQTQPTTLGQTNTFAFLAIIFAFLVPVLGVVFGHIGLSQIKRSTDGGRGIAITGLIIGYAYCVFLFFFMFLYVSMFLAFLGTMSSYSSYGTYS